MANVEVTLKTGRSISLPNTTVAAVVTALGTGYGQAAFTLASGEQIALSNDEIAGIVQEGAGALDSGKIGGEEPGSGRSPAS